MGTTQGGIIVGSADAHNVSRQALITEVIFDLFKASLHHKWGDAVQDRYESFLRQPGADTGHGLLADADIINALRINFESVAKSKYTDIAQKHDQAFILRQEVLNSLNELLPHANS